MGVPPFKETPIYVLWKCEGLIELILWTDANLVSPKCEPAAGWREKICTLVGWVPIKWCFQTFLIFHTFLKRFPLWNGLFWGPKSLRKCLVGAKISLGLRPKPKTLQKTQENHHHCFTKGPFQSFIILSKTVFGQDPISRLRKSESYDLKSLSYLSSCYLLAEIQVFPAPTSFDFCCTSFVLSGQMLRNPQRRWWWWW